MISSIFKAWRQHHGSAAFLPSDAGASGLSRAGILRLMATGLAGASLGLTNARAFAEVASDSAPCFQNYQARRLQIQGLFNEPQTLR